MAFQPLHIALCEPRERLPQQHDVVVDLIGLRVEGGVLEVVAGAV